MGGIDIKKVTQMSGGEAEAVDNNMVSGFRGQVDRGIINKLRNMKIFANLRKAG